MIRSICVAIAFVLLSLNGARAASFNCTFAKSPTEVAICRDASLGAMDEKMADTFFKLRQQLPKDGLQQLKSGQKDFMSRRNFCGTDGDCIEGMYAERMETLCNLANEFNLDCGEAAQ
jgi:uncharacterized protein